MNCSSPIQIPSSFDPALFLHSEQSTEPNIDSDEAEAVYLQAAETTAAKNRAGVVIQHRLCDRSEVFRSEDEYSIRTPTKESTRREQPQTYTLDPLLEFPPSSPPQLAMPLISSPIAYPPSSDPPIEAPRKKRKVELRRSPLHDVPPNQGRKVLGGFLADESDDEDDVATFKLKNFPIGDKTRRGSPRCQDGVPQKGHDNTHSESIPREQPQVSQEPLCEPIYDQQSQLGSLPAALTSGTAVRQLPKVVTCSGKRFTLSMKRPSSTNLSYEELIAQRSSTAPGRAKKSYYGIDIHQLIDDAAREAKEAAALSEIQRAESELEKANEPLVSAPLTRKSATLMWTEKYRARKFTDLVGDERTHRSVLRWFKNWDPIVFPGAQRPKFKNMKADDEEFRHRKILLLTGPPGLGKTTLAHVCARQAGYEVQEINASDERSSNVVKGRIRDMAGTENVRGIDSKNAKGDKVRKAARPVCVVIDEVDGVVGGSGASGEGGFVKALIDLVQLDQRNSNKVGDEAYLAGKKRKGDKFRLLRPLVLICNDVYHPSLRPLRQSNLAEIVHIRKPSLNMVVSRMQSVFEKEGVAADVDGVRRLCEATWGVSNHKEGRGGSGTGEGDIRGVMVVSEFVAGKFRAARLTTSSETRLSRRWVEENVINDLSHGGGAARNLGRGGTREVVERLFQEGAGFPKASPTGTVSKGGAKIGTVGVAESNKRRACERLREMIDTSGDSDKIIQDAFTAYPTKPFQDDTFLSKPNHASKWLNFHDRLSSLVFSSQEWELGGYLSVPALAFHDLFASSARQQHSNQAGPRRGKDSEDATEGSEHPFLTSAASFVVAEQMKANRAALDTLRSMLSLPLLRVFRSPESLATELLPPILRMLSPDVHPVVINTGAAGNKHASTATVRKASERELISRSINAMIATGVRFERARIEDPLAMSRNGGGYIFRMEPGLDALMKFETAGKLGDADDRVRFAVRQVLDAEVKREEKRRAEAERKKRGGIVDDSVEVAVDEAEGQKSKQDVINEASKKTGVKRDFFGRIIQSDSSGDRSTGHERTFSGDQSRKRPRSSGKPTKDEGRIWISYNEGFSNAVRKPLTLKELMDGL